MAFPSRRGPFGSGRQADLLDRSVRHGFFLLRAEAGIERQMAELLDRAIPDLAGILAQRLARIGGRGRLGAFATRSTYAFFLRDVAEWSRGVRDAAGALANELLRDLASREASFWIRGLASDAGIEVGSVPRGLAGRAAGSTFLGGTLREHLAGWARSTTASISGRVRSLLLEGRGDGDILAGVRGSTARGFRDGVLRSSSFGLGSIGRSAATSTASVARDGAFGESREIRAVLWISVLDDRTTVQCATLDGTTFPIQEGPRPPIHYRCRSTTAPVVLGEVMPKIPTYEQWLRGQPIEVQNEVLGVGRARIFRSGRVPFDRFTDRRNVPLTLADLEALERKIEAALRRAAA